MGGETNTRMILYIGAPKRAKFNKRMKIRKVPPHVPPAFERGRFCLRIPLACAIVRRGIRGIESQLDEQPKLSLPVEAVAPVRWG